MRRLRKTTLLVLVTGIFILAAAVTAQAYTAPADHNLVYIGPTGDGDSTNLYQIINGWLGTSYSNADLANLYGKTAGNGPPNPITSLPLGTYYVEAYAAYAAFSQAFGYYIPGSPPTYPTNASPGPNPIIVLGSNNYVSAGTPGTTIATGGAVKLNSVGGPVAFYDYVDSQTQNGGIYYIKTTEPEVISGTKTYNGLIFQFTVGSYTDYVVAFEDGDSCQPYGDQDYNDLVVLLSTNPGGAVPLPPSALLLGSGLLGLVGLGWRRGRAG